MNKEELKSGMKLAEHTVLFHSFASERPIRTASPEVVRGTKCIIKKNGSLVAESEVLKSHLDLDNKATAREFALKKAIRTIDNKELRTIIWNSINTIE